MRRSLARAPFRLLAVPAVVVALLAPSAAYADTSTATDPSGDATSSVDILTARYMTTASRVSLRVTTRTMSSAGVFRMKIQLLTDVDIRVDVARKADGGVKIKCTGYDYTDEDFFTYECAGASGTWDIPNKTVTVSVPREDVSATSEYAPYTFQAFSYLSGQVKDTAAKRTLQH